jgi:hypothetical protein
LAVAKLLLACLAIGLLVYAASHVPVFFRSAEDYGLHHEVTAPLCRFLAALLLSLGCAFAAAGGHAPDQIRKSARVLGAAVLVALLYAGAALLFRNAAYFSLFDPKGLPVHPAEVVMFPQAGWHGMGAHLIAAAVICAAFSLLWFALRRNES